jgi:diguanylate cyclase (GGDEF)-like protein
MSNVWIELGLNRVDARSKEPQVPAPASDAPPAAPVPSPSFGVLPDMTASLLTVIGDMAPESLGIDTASFRDLLRQKAEYVQAQPHALTASWVAECVDACYGFLRRAQAHLAERETEFSELIAVLSEMVSTLGGGESFNDRLDHSADRLNKIVDINDIRILKRRLAVEIETLKRLSAEKRQQDESHRSYFTEEIHRLQTRLALSMEEASLDQLTRVANRGRFERMVDQWIRSHRVSGLPFVLAMIDVDDFKTINDTFGHQEGDRVLVAIARTLAGAVRPTDLVARFGGDEFVVMLAQTTSAQALERLRQIMGTLAGTTVGSPDTVPPFALSLSIGVTDWSVEDDQAELLGRADQAMYDAKRAGKGRIEVKKRPGKSRLFQNGRPVAGAVGDVESLPRTRAAS